MHGHGHGHAPAIAAANVFATLVNSQSQPQAYEWSCSIKYSSARYSYRELCAWAELQVAACRIFASNCALNSLLKSKKAADRPTGVLFR